jgi:hypothetical protein
VLEPERRGHIKMMMLRNTACKPLQLECVVVVWSVASATSGKCDQGQGCVEDGIDITYRSLRSMPFSLYLDFVMCIPMENWWRQNFYFV